MFSTRLSYNCRFRRDLDSALPSIGEVYSYDPIYERSTLNMTVAAVHIVSGKTELERIAEDYGQKHCARMTVDHEASLKRSKDLRFIKFYDADSSPEICFNLIALTKNIKTPSKAFRTNLCFSLRQIKAHTKMIRRINECRLTHFDWNNEEHSCMIRKLWILLKPGEVLRENITDQWTSIGFQNDDPSTDFRGMGMLGLHNLLHFASNFPTFARSLCTSYKSSDSYRYPPFAITGINLTSDCFSIVVRREAGQFFYSYGSNFSAFGDLFAWSLYEFDIAWREVNPPSVMAFRHVRGVFIRRLKEKLNRGYLLDIQGLRDFASINVAL